MKPAKRIVIAVLIGLIVAGTAAATGTGEQAAPASGQRAPVSMRFSWWGADSRHQATLAAIAEYQKANPGVTIDGEYGGYDGYFQKLTTQLASGTAPDIIQFDASMTNDLLRLGDIFVDVNTKKNIIDISGFGSSFLNDFCVYGNRMVGLPTGINAGAVLVNTAVTQAAGIDISTIRTWDDVIAAGTKLQAYNRNMYFYAIELITLGREFVYTNIAQLTGKEIIGPNFTLNFTRDDLYKVFDLVSRLYSSRTIQPAEEAVIYDTAPWTNPKWINNEIASCYLVTSFINSTNYKFQNTADVISQPTWPGAKESGVQLLPTQLIGVSSTSKAQDEAFRFLNFFFNDANAARILKDVRSIPATEVARQVCTEANLLDAMAVKAVNLALPIATMHQNLTVPNDIAQILRDQTAKVAYRQGTVAAITDETMQLLENPLQRFRQN